MAKMRTMTHHGRGKNKGGKAYGSKHDDRNFDVTKAKNIDPELTPENLVWHIYMDEQETSEGQEKDAEAPTDTLYAPMNWRLQGMLDAAMGTDYAAENKARYFARKNADAAGEKPMTFEEVETRFYQETFSEQLRQTNDKYRANGHSERVKDMAAWMRSRRNSPVESIYQIGDKHITGQHVDAQTLKACYDEFAQEEQKWNEEHGRPFTILNRAMHVDEPECPPHIHVRRAWHYKAEDGTLRVGQEKALAQAGVELPDPTKKEGRYNNRKMTYDAMMREKWLDILERHGLEVEREPVPGSKGKPSRDKEDYIRDKYDRMTAEADKAAQMAQDATKQAEAAQTKAYALEGQTAAMEGQIIVLQGKIEDAEAAAAEAAANAEASVAAAEAAAKDAQMKAEQDILEAQERVYAMQQAYEGQKAYVQKAKELATPEVLFPDYVERTVRGVFKKEEMVTLPLDKWKERHVSETDFMAIAAQQKALEGLEAKNEQLTREAAGKAHMAIQIVNQNNLIQELKEENSRLRGIVDRALTQIRDGAWKIWQRFVKPAKAQNPKVLDFDDSLNHWQQQDKDTYQQQSAAMPEVRLYQGILGSDRLMAEMMAMDGERKAAIRRALKERYPRSDVLVEKNDVTR